MTLTSDSEIMLLNIRLMHQNMKVYLAAETALGRYPFVFRGPHRQRRIVCTNSREEPKMLLNPETGR